MKQATRGRELSSETRRELVGMHKGDMSFADIERETGVSANTALKVWQPELAVDLPDPGFGLSKLGRSVT
jgi:hypothetical protein